MHLHFALKQHIQHTYFKSAMKKFEYRVLVADWTTHESPPQIERLLNQEGNKGWELVGSTREQYPTDLIKNNEVILILKRIMR